MTDNRLMKAIDAQIAAMSRQIELEKAAYSGRSDAWLDALRKFGNDAALMSALRPVSDRFGTTWRQGPWIEITCGRSHGIGPVRVRHNGGPNPASALRLEAGRALARHLTNAELVGGESIDDPTMRTATLLSQRRQWRCRLASCEWREPRGYRPEHILGLYETGLRFGLRRVPLAIERR